LRRSYSLHRDLGINVPLASRWSGALLYDRVVRKTFNCTVEAQLYLFRNTSALSIDQPHSFYKFKIFLPRVSQVPVKDCQ
jgi:hypothetical protein